MELVSSNAKVLYYLYVNRRKKDYALAELSAICLCNYFKTDNIVMVLGEEKFIRLAKRYEDNEWFYEIVLTEKGKRIGKQVGKLLEVCSNYSGV